MGHEKIPTVRMYIVIRKVLLEHWVCKNSEGGVVARVALVY